MSAISVRQFLREFAVYASLSFIVILSIIHVVLCLAQIFCFPPLTFTARLLAQLLGAPEAMQLSPVAELSTYLLVVFKVTIACTILLIASRELIETGGSYLGWWGARKSQGDAEKGDHKPPLRWGTDERTTEQYTFGAPILVFYVAAQLYPSCRKEK
ncbi:hypothetical protein B0H17DRAFT_1144967 [Mycena rosella]|uniref:Uncharacterized protein n=1 Tax=Mycena rosella TaxID=1033263 RepID=A0AAD7G2C1_MYCRO|nr:hypothetical protein B0H17DRAFT_1144967 [Mycena rosella]